MGYYKNRITERYDAASEPMPVYWFRFQELTEKKMRMQTDRLRGGWRVRSEELACTDPRYVFHPKDVTTALELEKQNLLVNGYSEEDLAWIEQLVAEQVPHFYDLLDPEVVVHTVLREEASGTGILYLDAEKTMESINALEKNLS